MKISKSFFAGISLGLLSLPLLADENSVYFSAGMGQGFVSELEGDATVSGTKYNLNLDFDSAFIYDLEIGKKLDDWRLGISYSSLSPQQNNVTASGSTAAVSPKPHFDVQSIMFNIYRDFSTEGKFTPYAGLGLGTSNIKIETHVTTVAGDQFLVSDDGRNVFGWDLKAGLTYSLTEQADVYTEVVYHQTSKFNEDGINYDAFKTTNVMGGVKFNF